MFDRDSSSVVRSLIGLFAFRSNPVSKVYQHRSRGSSLVDGAVKDTAAGELTPDPFPQLANGKGPNRTRAQWKFTSADALVNECECRIEKFVPDDDKR